MVVELTHDDWNRLTRLVHLHGSVRELEQALSGIAHTRSAQRGPVDLADMVRVEVAHQLDAGHSARCHGSPATSRVGELQRVMAFRVTRMPALSAMAWRSYGASAVALVLVTTLGLSRIGAVGVGILALIGLHLGLQDFRRLGSILWRAAIAACAVAWTIMASWPVEVSALMLGSAFATCIVEPGQLLRSRRLSA